MAKSKQPNILILWGDDIGQSNLSIYTKGMMGYHTPNIDRIAKEGMLFTDYYAEQSCTAGRAAFITGQSGLRTGLTKVGLPGAELGMQRRGPHHRRAAEAAGLRAPASSARTTSATATSICRRCTASTSSSATSTTSTPRRSPRLRDYPNAEGLPRIPQEVRPARRAALLGRRQGRPEDREHRPADQEADGDHRRGVPGRGQDVHQEPRTPPASRSSCGSTPPTCTSAPTSKPESRGPVGALAVGVPRRDDRPRQVHRRDARPARRAGHRRRHDRDVQHRQRAAHEQLARCRHDAVPQREELQLGRAPTACPAWCAGRARSSRARCATTSSATSTGCPRCWPRPASRTSRRS